MSEHLPECTVRVVQVPCPDREKWNEDHTAFMACAALHMGEVDCICPELRACEQRVRHERPWMADWTAGNKQGWTDALDAAREAIAALPMMKIAGNFPLYDADEVIAAIDALRGER